MRNYSHRYGSHERGSALLIVITFTAILGLIAATVLRGAVVQRRLTDRYQLYNQELAIAELQLNKAFGQISYALQRGGSTDPQAVVDLVGPAPVPDYEIRQFNVELLGDEMKPFTEGIYEGYTLRQLRYRVSAHVRRTGARGAMYDHPGVALKQDMEITYIPFSIFGIFSDPDLELHPGADFVENGWVHSNGNFYYGSDGKKFDVRNRVTVAKEIIYGRHPNSGKGLGQGTNSFWNDTLKKLVGARDGSANLDSRYKSNGVTFADKARALWDKGVRDGTMGARQLRLPWPSDVDGYVIEPSEYIQPKKASDKGPLLKHKFTYKAGLYITRKANGTTVATRPDGTAVSLSYKVGNTTRQIVTTGGFHNEREGENVSTLDIDLANMKEAGIAPANGMVYVENQQSQGAVRLLNGTDLPGNHNIGFSVATPNALYVKGNYNTKNETLSMLAADAVYILSDGWKDADNTQSKRGSSTPTASGSVTTNAVIGAGNVPTQIEGNGKKQYSGGVENFFRYMENWSGKTHTFKGSIMLMFHSLHSTGFWEKQKYNPPDRAWSWNPVLATRTPPGAPVSFETRRTNWDLGT